MNQSEQIDDTISGQHISKQKQACSEPAVSSHLKAMDEDSCPGSTASPSSAVRQKAPTDFIDRAVRVGISLDEGQIDQLIRYEEELRAYSYLGLTSIMDREEVFCKHFLDSLSILPLNIDLKGRRLIDIGAGGGFPSMPLKIAVGDMHVTLLDSVGKKVHFLKDLIDELKLDDCDPIHARVEDLAHEPLYRESFDIVTARAVKETRMLLEYSIPFLKIGAKAYFWKTKKQEEEIMASDKALKELGASMKILELPDIGEGDRIIVEVTKQKATSKKYPRSPLKIKNAPL